MGVYIYTLRQSNPINTPDGPVYLYHFRENVASTSTFHKPTLNRHGRLKPMWEWEGYIPRERQDAWVSRLQDKHRHLDNCLVAIYNDDGREGLEVYRQSRSVPVWYDWDDFPGELVGTTRKRGRQYYISKEVSD